jgi:tellurite resistance protein
MLNDTPLWRSTPPAIFPICLALLGLGLGWRTAAEVLPTVAIEVGDVLLGLGSAFYVFFLLNYLRKLSARPMVLFDDMTNPAARAGIAAAAMSMMMLAAALLPFGISAPFVWWIGVVAQIGASAAGCWAIWRDPPDKRKFSTFQYLTFVGPVVGPFAGIKLGYVTESLVLTLAALVAYVIITIGLIVQLRHAHPSIALRPSMAIFLAPVCLFATSFGMLGIDWAFTIFYWLSIAIAVVLFTMIPWMIKGGFSPVWASFTFPVAAFLGVQVMAVIKYGNDIHAIGVYGAMIVATPVILIIAYRATLRWATGDLARASNSAQV